MHTYLPPCSPPLSSSYRTQAEAAETEAAETVASETLPSETEASKTSQAGKGVKSRSRHRAGMAPWRSSQRREGTIAQSTHSLKSGTRKSVG